MMRALFLQDSHFPFSEEDLISLKAHFPHDTEITIHSSDYLFEAQNLIDSVDCEYILCSAHLNFSAWQLVDFCIFEKKFVLEGSLEDILERECLAHHVSGHIYVQTPDYDIQLILHPQQYFNIKTLHHLMTVVAFLQLCEETHTYFGLDLSLHYALEFANANHHHISPDYLDFFSKIPSITPRQLLTHTAGIQQYTPDIETLLSPTFCSWRAIHQTLENISPQNELYISEYAYLLLALAIDAYTGDYNLYLQEHLWRPLEMSNTFATKGFSNRQIVLPEIKVPTLPETYFLDLTNEIDRQLADDYNQKCQEYLDVSHERQKLLSYFYDGLTILSDEESWNDFVHDIQEQINLLSLKLPEELILLNEINAFIAFYQEEQSQNERQLPRPECRGS